MLSVLRLSLEAPLLQTTRTKRIPKRKCLQSRHQSTTTASHPYTFHVGASWIGKPHYGKKMKTKPFPADSPIGIWRDKMVMWPKAIPGTNAGEDFFYIEKVRPPLPTSVTRV
jgi:protein phosphatase PTC7